jgi:oxygen-independent coproporphyrinogen-3 oxidase
LEKTKEKMMTDDGNLIVAEPATTARDWKQTEVGSVFVSNYPPYSFWEEDTLDRALTVLDSPGDPDTPLGLYLHIPFCRKRCKFCYFRVFTDKNARDIDRYLEALAAEVELYAPRKLIEGRSLDFVYFGGGTPSYISVKHLKALVDRVKAVFPWDRAREVAFECEPGTLTQSKLEAIREIGVTRLSLGVENMNDEILRENGRAHLTHEINEVLPWVKALNFQQVNVDLISGMVGETWETWCETVARTVEMDADTVTIYQMELPFNTTYSKALREGESGAPNVADWETKRAWNDYAIERFLEADYEVSSAYTLSKRGRQGGFVYRDALWRSADMIGTGVASISHIGGLHYQNKTAWDTYLADLEEGKLAVGRGFIPSDEERLTREMILQLKLGYLRPSYFREKFGEDILSKFGAAYSGLEDDGMLSIEKDRIQLSRRGALRVDQLLPRFYHAAYNNARYT